MPEGVAEYEFLEEQVMPDEYRTSAATEEQVIAEANKFADDFNARNLVLEEYVRARTRSGPVQFQSPELVEIQESMSRRQEGAYTPGEAESLQRLAVAPVPDQIDFSGGGSGVAGMPDGFPSARQVPFRAVPPAPDKERELEDIRKGFGIAGIEAETRAAAAKVAKEEKLSKDIGEELSSFRIQPFRAYENTMFAVVAALSAAIGAAAQSLTGVPNTALKLIDDAINKDIDAQKAQYAALKDKSEVQNNVYGRAMNVLGDAKAAEKQAKLAGFSAWQQRLNALRGDRKEAVNLNATIDMFNATAQANKDKLQMEMSAKPAKGKEDANLAKVAGAFGVINDFVHAYEQADTGVGTSVFAAFSGSDYILSKADDATRKLVMSHKSAKGQIPVITTSIMKASGDSGNIGNDERETFEKSVKLLIPSMSLMAGFDADTKAVAIEMSRIAMADLMGILGLGKEVLSDPSKREFVQSKVAKLRQSIDKIEKLTGGGSPEKSAPRAMVPKGVPDIKDFPGMGQFSY